jgi:hypothetical protein
MDSVTAPFVVLIVGLSLATADAVAQARFGTTQAPSRQAPPASQETRPFAASPYRSQRSERCANFQRELRLAREQEREAVSTGDRDQSATRRQEIFEAKQKAGC